MSTINRILSSDNVSLACLFVGAGSFIYLYGRESIFQNIYIDRIQKRRNGEPIPAHSILKDRLETVLDDLDISRYNREFYDVFITKELDPITCGAMSIRQGVKIGIPEHFQAASMYGLRAANNTIYGTTIPWTSEDGERLAESLSLSENAEKFAIAKAVALSNCYYYLLHATFPPFFCWGYFSFTEFIFSFKKLNLRSGLFTLGTYLLSGILFGVVYLFCDEVLYLQYDKITFDDVMNLSNAYMLGAVEYSEKAVERNKALRNILKNGHRYFDEEGDVSSFWSSSGLPVSVRPRYAQEKMEHAVALQQFMVPAPVNPNPLSEF